MNRLAITRRTKRVTQAEVAALANVRLATVSDIERGVSAGRWSTQRRIAAALGEDIDAVFPLAQEDAVT
jgi:DNA-binding XRE family transcriptional regulator